MANLRVDKITSTETFETTGSVQFDGSGDFLTVADNADFNLGTGDFTLEAWVYHQRQDSSETKNIYSQRNASENGISFRIRRDGVDNSQCLDFFYDNNGTGETIGATEVSLHTWHHVALTRKDGVVRIFLDGVLDATKNLSGVDFGSASGFGPVIGARKSDGDEEAFGFISNIRLIKGIALYTANFKPPMRELEVVPGTVLLACQSKTDATLEKTGKTITVTGNAVASELTPGLLTPVPKAGGGSAITGSVEFDGSGDYLTLANSSDLAFGTGDFTLDCWIYANETPSDDGIFESRDGSVGATNGFTLTAFSSSVIRIYSGSALISSSATYTNQWNHIAVTRYSGTLNLFINGISQGTSTASLNMTNQDCIIGGGRYAGDSSVGANFKGFISNFRLVKGTALYTDDFIPPTRELKRVPGTVLLCCQDPNNPLTEATGKTITGYGSLSRTDIGVNLVSNGDFTSNTDNWTANGSTLPTLSVDTNRLKLTHNGANGGAYQNITTVVGSTYDISAILTDGNSSGIRLRVYGDGATGDGFQGTNYIGDVVTDATPTLRIHRIVAETTTTRVYVEILGSNTQYAFADDIKAVKLDPGNRASNFTPQVGDDRKVTFEGVTKINSNAYFYLPTGNTASRYKNTSAIGNGRMASAGSYSDDGTIDYITISSTGNAQDFGDLAFNKNRLRGAASSTRGLFMGGASEQIQYITMATTGDAKDFGDSTSGSCQNTGLCSNNNRAVNFIGTNPSTNGIEFMTISTMGVVQDFGDQVVGVRHVDAFSSPTRGMITGGWTSGNANTDTIQFITFATTGNAVDFGNINATGGVRGHGGFSSPTRGVCGGGIRGPALSNAIDFVTIASTGDAQDFGDLVSARRVEGGGASSHIRGIFAGGYQPSSPYPSTNSLDYVTIASTGNAQDFGDMTSARTVGAASDAHGGLG